MRYAILTAAAAVTATFVPLPSAAVERWYSLGVYPVIQNVVTWLSSLVSVALLDLDGPALRSLGGVASGRDLTDPEVWDISQTRARAKRLAAEPGTLPQARVAGAAACRARRPRAT